MELRHLRYFLAAAEELHFGRAAETLCVTRPAVSQTVSDLETELGVKLFFRHAQKITLTSAGEAFQRDLRILMSDLGRAVETTRRIGSGKTGNINVGYGSLSLLHPAFRATVKGVRRQYSEIDISLHEMPSSRQIPAVRAGRLDAGFVYVPEGSAWPPGTVSDFMAIDDLDSLELDLGGLAVAMPSDHPLAAQAAVRLQDLANDGLIVVQRSNVTPRLTQLETMCLAEGFSPRVIQEVGNIATQVNLISVGMGIGIVVNSPRMSYPDSVRILPLIGVDLPVRFTLIWRRGAIEPTLATFIEQVKDTLDDVESGQGTVGVMS
ncbi:LysR substrate-binding domain-containing protein [Salipiger abyssi]|uniref:Transcriptional regulator n=1 Tax=Salipiger abyssi TaxID=1250539 RepID=A0A1P8V0Y1_9RHOB|nr:LysR substrate-binding domain-containing protein [Salipiger abyssi]APZ55278.1 transcriptional regulator [Salipiger abyssi]